MCVCVYIYIYTHTYIFFFAVLGLSCNTWNLCGSPQAPQCVGFVAVVHKVNRPTACGILVPQPGTELVSPKSEGEFLTSGSPRSTHDFLYCIR